MNAGLHGFTIRGMTGLGHHPVRVISAALKLGGDQGLDRPAGRGRMLWEYGVEDMGADSVTSTGLAIVSAVGSQEGT